MPHRRLLSLVALVMITLVTFLAPANAARPPVGPAISTADNAIGDVASVHVAADPTWINTQDRATVQSFFVNQYRGSARTLPASIGDPATCTPGTPPQDLRDGEVARINYFRAMAGVPATITFSDTYNLKDQQAALMMSANKKLDHQPPSTWQCYTPDGAQAAGSSNLSLGVAGTDAIDGYIKDPGSNNTFVGHRRWILYPPMGRMGSGDVVAPNYQPANALWVFDSADTRPATRDAYVAWPPTGYVPYQIVFARWSFAYDQADFSNATVTMSSGGTNIPVAVAPVNQNQGYADNTLVWIPNNMGDRDPWPQPTADTTYTVKIDNVMINKQPTSFTYQVTIFDPDATAPNPTPTGTTTTTGATATTAPTTTPTGTATTTGATATTAPTTTTGPTATTVPTDTISTILFLPLVTR